MCPTQNGSASEVTAPASARRVRTGEGPCGLAGSGDSVDIDDELGALAAAIGRATEKLEEARRAQERFVADAALSVRICNPRSCGTWRFV